MDKAVLALVIESLCISPTAYSNWHAEPVMEYTGEDDEILIYGAIVDDSMIGFYRDWMGDESVISARMFKEQLDKISGKVTLRINSPGGNVMEASTMIQAIEERDGEVVCVVDGVAASAASLLMAVCADVTVAKMGQVMIHSAQTYAGGNSKELMKIAGVLADVDKQAISVYKNRMKSSEKKILEMLDEETWFTAEAAVKEGLGDRVFEPKNKGDKTKTAIAGQRNQRFAAIMSAL